MSRTVYQLLLYTFVTYTPLQLHLAALVTCYFADFIINTKHTVDESLNTLSNCKKPIYNVTLRHVVIL